MPELLKEHLGEIAFLIYILYPLLRRWWQRRKKKAEQAKPAAEAEAAKRPRPSARSAPRPQPPQATRPPEPSVDKRPSEDDFLTAARTRLLRLKRSTSDLLAQAQREPRLSRLIPPLREDLLGRLEQVERSLAGSPTLSTIVQETTVLRGLDSLLLYLNTMAQQRLRGGASFLAEADAMADACYAPLLDLARAQGLGLRTTQAITVTGDADLSLVSRFASTRIAPLRLPRGFERSLWHWPAIAHEVAHDFYYSFEGLESDLHARLGLGRELELPLSSTELDAAWLRQAFGAWLSEVVADVIGTVSLGPAYVETMRRSFRNPSSPQRTAAILQNQSLIDEHPPARLRIYMATRVLHHLGRHEEADALWESWETEHADVRFYYLPLQGQWVGLSDEAIHSTADSIIELLVQRAWPELEGFQLLNIPGLAYQHAEHAEVKGLMRELARGEVVDASPRWIMAAAVLAAAAQPALHDQILETAKRSLAGRGVREQAAASPKHRHPTASIGKSLVTSLKQPQAIQEAILLGAALTPYKRPRLG